MHAVLIMGTTEVKVDEPPTDYDDLHDYDFRDATVPELKLMHGTKVDEYDFQDFASHLGEDLAEKIMPGSYMTFLFDEKLQKLIVGVLYLPKETLTTEEIEELKDHTQGQWSDGIGECYEQCVAKQTDTGLDMYVSAWHDAQKLDVALITPGQAMAMVGLTEKDISNGR